MGTLCLTVQVFLVGFLVVGAEERKDVEICIVGGGPGGIQVAQLLGNRGVDYLLFERADGAGDSFKRYPRHRKLISLNKRNTGRSDPEFNLRHDWNSLLENEAIGLFTSRTKKRWPDADTMVKYLADFAQDQEKEGKIRYRADVRSIKRVEGRKGTGFILKLASVLSTYTKEETYWCKRIIMATGFEVPNSPENINGIEYVDQYRDLPETGEVFEGESVAVLGLGNSAFETADALSSFTNFVHVFPGRATHRKDSLSFVSWESRYVGSVRALNAGLLDAYLLKSLDGGFQNDDTADRMTIRKCGSARKKRCVFRSAGRPPPYDKLVLVGSFNTADKQATRLMEKLKKMAPVTLPNRTFLPTPFTSYSLDGALAGSAVDILTSRPGFEVLKINTTTPVMEVLLDIKYLDDPSVVDAAVALSKRSPRSPSVEYDRIIACLGWAHNNSVFDSNESPVFLGKFPSLTPDYESVNIDGMYFAGALSHGRDAGRAAGGFIHGFRYTARALVRILLAEGKGNSVGAGWEASKLFLGVQDWDGIDVGPGVGEGQSWPDPIIGTDAPRGMPALIDHLFARINKASGPYQMISELGDGIVFRCNHEGGVDAEYLEEIPIAHFNAKYADSPRAIWVFGYNGQRRSLEDSRFDLTKFEVFLYLYPGNHGCIRRASSKNTPHTEIVEAENLEMALETEATQVMESLKRIKELESVSDGRMASSSGEVGAGLKEIAKMKEELELALTNVSLHLATVREKRHRHSGSLSNKLLFRLSESLATEWNSYDDRRGAAIFLHQAVTKMATGALPPANWLLTRKYETHGTRQHGRWFGGEVVLIISNLLGGPAHAYRNDERLDIIEHGMLVRHRTCEPDTLYFFGSEGAKSRGELPLFVFRPSIDQGIVQTIVLRHSMIGVADNQRLPGIIRSTPLGAFKTIPANSDPYACMHGSCAPNDGNDGIIGVAQKKKAKKLKSGTEKYKAFIVSQRKARNLKTKNTS